MFSSFSVLTELFHAKRFPQLNWRQRWQLIRIRWHWYAPRYRNFSGHRLSNEQITFQRQVHASIAASPAIEWAESPVGREWFGIWWQHVRQKVPYFSAFPSEVSQWAALPTMDREALNLRLAEHVPKDILREPAILCFSTSGTTGHPIHVPSLPTVAAQYAAYHCRALTAHGVTLRALAGDLGVALVGVQSRCFTYVSVNPFNGSGLIKINLEPSEWRNPSDRAAYLNALRPELITGDPLSLAALAQLPITHHPKAILSTSMALAEGLRLRLEARFQCPVVDVYSMNEAGPIAAFVPHLGGHLLLQPELFVEILDEFGRVVPEGECGEITLTGGFNTCIPLLRYRTGDYASKLKTSSGDVLVALQGRAPVRFQTSLGQWINNVEITQALSSMGLTRFSLHQAADATLTLAIDPYEDTSPQHPATIRALHTALSQRFLAALPPLTIVALRAVDKVKQYSSDLTPETIS